jgi:hypothetical protein
MRGPACGSTPRSTGLDVGSGEFEIRSRDFNALSILELDGEKVSSWRTESHDPRFLSGPVVGWGVSRDRYLFPERRLSHGVARRIYPLAHVLQATHPGVLAVDWASVRECPRGLRGSGAPAEGVVGREFSPVFRLGL